MIDLDNELINHLIIDDSVRKIRSENLKPELAVDPISQKALSWQLVHLKEHGAIASQAVLETEFDIEIEATEVAIGDLIKRLRERYVRNIGREITLKLGETAMKDPLELGKLMTGKGRDLIDLTDSRGEAYGTGDHEASMLDYHLMATKGQGPSLGWSELDEHFWGLKGLSFLIAPPKTFKSWGATRSAMIQAINGGFPYYYCLELPASESEWRFKCMTANIPYWKYLRGKLTEPEQATLEKVAKEIDASGTHMFEKPKQEDRTAAHMVERAINKGATSIIIDQLQYMNTKEGKSLGQLNNTGDYWEVCNDLRDYSDQIPIYVVHQFNRESRFAEAMPDFQTIKGSSAIEETATLCLGMFASKEMRKSKVLQIGTLLSRNYEFADWEIQVELSKGCSFDMIGPAPE